MSHDYMEIEQLVNHLILNNRALNQCIREEQRCYSANDDLGIEQVYSHKVKLNDDLKHLLRRLNSHLVDTVNYGDFLVKLSFYAGTLDARNQANLLNLIQCLREEYKIRLQLLQFNQRGANSKIKMDRLKDFECI